MHLATISISLNAHDRSGGFKLKNHVKQYIKQNDWVVLKESSTKQNCYPVEQIVFSVPFGPVKFFGKSSFGFPNFFDNQRQANYTGIFSYWQVVKPSFICYSNN